ncbi:hypothetical protein ACFYUM_03905 [Streptomyces fimicarius]|uniref:hypothetical protein n=1 Tax=Streptomyces griseus TaxID=1911 RepID=UPI003685E279
MPNAMVQAAYWGAPRNSSAASPAAVAGWVLLVILAQVILAAVPLAVILAFTKLRNNRLSARLGVIVWSIAVTVAMLGLATTTGTAGSA